MEHILHALIIGIVRHVEVYEALLNGGNGVIVVCGGGIDITVGVGGSLARSKANLIRLLKVELELLPSLVGLDKTITLSSAVS